jgi:hypothetical protein
LFSVLLLVWLAGATSLEFFYTPASHGRKAVYLTLASFGFLVLAMLGVLTTPHGQIDPQQTAVPDAVSWVPKVENSIKGTRS